MIGIFGGGGIAEGIIEIVGGDVYEADVRDYAEVRTVLSRHNPLVVINCAGVSHPSMMVGSRSDWIDEINVNLVGSYHVARASVAQGVRTQIHVASVAGLYGKPNHSGYCASKAGVISLVRSLAMEGEDAYAISPGRVDTKMRERDYPGEDPRTRLVPEQIGWLVRDVLEGLYEPGDNLILRKIGFDTHFRVDKGEPWRDWLNVQPA